MKRNSGALISFSFVLLYSILQPGCFIDTMGLLDPNRCRDSPESPIDGRFGGCYERTVESPDRYDPDMYLRIEQREDCPSLLNGEGSGLVGDYAFTGNVVERGEARLRIPIGDLLSEDPEVHTAIEFQVDAQIVSDGLLMNWRGFSQHDSWHSMPEAVSLPYFLQRTECPETEVHE